MAENYRCNKGPKIEAMCRDIDALNKAVFRGNGQKSILQLLTETQDEIKPMASDIDVLSSNVQAMIIAQNRYEARREIKEEIQQKAVIRNRWVIGSMIAAMGIITTLIALLV